jgi:hypothetical protein
VGVIRTVGRWSHAWPRCEPKQALAGACSANTGCGVGIRIALNVGFGWNMARDRVGQSGCGHVRESGWARFSKNDQARSVKKEGLGHLGQAGCFRPAPPV